MKTLLSILVLCVIAIGLIAFIDRERGRQREVIRLADEFIKGLRLPRSLEQLKRDAELAKTQSVMILGERYFYPWKHRCKTASEFDIDQRVCEDAAELAERQLREAYALIRANNMERVTAWSAKP